MIRDDIQIIQAKLERGEALTIAEFKKARMHNGNTLRERMRPVVRGTYNMNDAVGRAYNLAIARSAREKIVGDI